MNRLEIIKEINDLIRKEKKKRIREQIQGRLINENFEPYEKSLYDEWKKPENKSEKEQWHQFVRLAVNFHEIEFMFSRINYLVTRYRKSTDGYFKANFQSGIAEIPDRSSELAQLFALSQEYFEIYKKIMNRINFGINQIISSGTIQGRINWDRTIKKSLYEFPLSFETDAWKKKFDVPENVLLVWIPFWLHSQIQKLMYEKYEKPLDFEEIRILKEISTNCKKIIKYFPFHSVIQTTRNDFSLDIKSKNISKLESQIKTRIKEGLIENKSYSALLKWFSKIKTFNFPNIRKKEHTANFLREAEKNIDAMYEIWIFFELLYHIDKKVEDIKLELNSIPHFIQFTLNHQEIKLYYEKKFLEGDNFAWAKKHVPDFSIISNHEIIGVLDAKNYSFHDDETPRDKILSYMTNLGTGYGGIIWPHNSLEYNFPRKNKSDSTKYHKNLKIVFYSLDPQMIANQFIDVEKTMNGIFTEIKNRLDPATKCPKCQIVAIGNVDIERLFGFRIIDGITRTQSWCRECRKTKPDSKK